MKSCSEERPETPSNSSRQGDMFSKNKKKLDDASSHSSAGAHKSSSSKPHTPSIISPDLRIFGDVSSEGEIQIDGSIEGDIRSDVLLVGQTAVIKGEIVADKVHVHGKVNGQIKARKVFLAKDSHVTGDILHEDLSIE
ncbi:MAG TPA: polymer-forming cytoskeletal protein, partial [Rhodospirillales bacterium]|nr:polymer-forming cytoskeletal protein [Rhodospirillales bacterium]